MLQNALLYHLGIPASAVPFRCDAGDILLFSSSHLMSYGTKLFTLSRVRLLSLSPSRTLS